MNTKRLNDLLTDNKISKADIVKGADISRPALDSILSGGDFKVSTLEKIAKFLKVHVGYFFDPVSEDYTATGTQGVAARHIEKLEQYSGDTSETQKQLTETQAQLIEAQKLIIDLLSSGKQENTPEK